MRQQPVWSRVAAAAGLLLRRSGRRRSTRRGRTIAAALGLLLLSLALSPRETTRLLATAFAQSADDLIVDIESPAPDSVVQGSVPVRGWAVDRNNPPRSGRGVNARDVQVWLGAPPSGRRLDFAHYGELSQAAEASIGPGFLSTGFSARWETCSFPPGPYELWVFVSSLGSPDVPGYNRVEVQVAPCAPGTEMYRAAFVDAAAWPPIVTSEIEAGPEDDGWTMHLKVPDAISESPPGVFANFRVEVTTRIVGASYKRLAYLQFREAPGPTDSTSDGYYRFSVDSDFASFDLSRWDGDQDVVLIPETRRPDVIHGPGLENRLAVVADGSRLQLLINDVPVGAVDDATYPWGRVGFGVWANGQPDATAHFRDFVITMP